jgi:TolA-binding protein
MTVPDLEKKALQEAMTALRAGDTVQAQFLFQKFLETYPHSPLADNACYNLAHLFLKKDDKPQALEWLNYLLQTYPNSDSAYMARDEILELRRLMGIGPAELPDELYRRGKDLLAQKQFALAEAVFVSFLDTFPESDLMDNVHYNLALLHKELGNFEKAKEHIDIILREYPDSDAASYAADLLIQE